MLIYVSCTLDDSITLKFYTLDFHWYETDIFLENTVQWDQNFDQFIYNVDNIRLIFTDVPVAISLCTQLHTVRI